MDIETCKQKYIDLSDTLPTLEKETLYAPPENIQELNDESIYDNGYKCYACQDTGWVVHWAVLKIIPGYSDRTDKYCVCDRLDTCREKVPDIIYELELFDTRFNKELLDKIHELNKLNWQQTTLEKSKYIQEKIQNFLDSY